MERHGRGRTALRRVIAALESTAVVAALAAPVLLWASPAAAAVNNVSWNVAAARSGTALVLTVTTSSDINCVTISPAPYVASASVQGNGQSTWTFNYTAGAGNGTQTVTASAFKNQTCSNAQGTGTASFLLDNTAPTITGSATPAPNANGWNNTNVAVNYSCSDSGAGIQSCSPTANLTTDGANQSVTGTAVDKVGNSASTTVSGINIDKTAPTLSGVPTTAPNANGWYNADVAVHWACADALSGIAGSCPPNSTITSEGSARTASASVTDKAGNTTSATSSPAVNIDRTAPLTTVTAPPAWNNTDVTVALNPSDGLSGVAQTYWSLDSGSTHTGTSVSISSEGDHTLTYWSVDKADNAELPHEVHVRIDKTPPTISHTQWPSANANGWNNTNVTVTFTCADALSGVASCTAPTTVTTEGQNQSVPGTATDEAGNTASDPATVSIDKTKPTITGARDRVANANGWYNDDVSVTFTCADALSGVASCAAPQTFGEGANQTATGGATDAAGNSDSATVSGINVDKTAPLLSGAPTTAPNTDGWYSGNVTIHWTCSDPLSGIDGACPSDSVITGSGTGLTVTAAVTDKAGNTTMATSAPVNIDRVAPVTTADAPSGWQSTDVTVHFSSSDDLSGVAFTFFSVDGGAAQSGSSVAITAEGTTLVQFWSVDVAGNVEGKQAVTVQLDKTAPAISHTQEPEPNVHGWNNVPVAVTFTCSDALSGIKHCSSPSTVSAEGAGQVVPGSAEDVAGNSASDSATVNLDATPPTISGSLDHPANANGWHNSPVTVTFACSDTLSGVQTCSAPASFGEGAAQSAHGTATDNADNVASTIVDHINVDTTAPTISGAATSSPNDAGWYNHDVGVEWTCNDNLSGIEGSCPANSTISGEGENLGTSASTSDKAGNTATGTVNGINIDTTAPATSANAPSAWTNHAVTVELDATDNLSGVAATHYILDGSADTTGTSVSITTEGEHTLEYWSVDVAGNEEAHHLATVRIDTTAPTISADLSPAPNVAGWNNSDVTVTFTCADQPGLSGLASCTPPQTVTTEGANQSVDGTASDNAGNSASASATVNLDKTKPAITWEADREPNANGWYNADVNVTFTCTDALSGIADCTAPVTLGEGSDQSVTGTAADAAGNSDTATAEHLNIDKTPPTITGAPTTAPNAHGWYRGNVTIHWSCNDGLSGLDGDCPADTVLTGEGAGLSATASISDQAGNHASATVDGINIDRTDPVTTSDAPGGWQSTDVVVGLTPQDALSGVDTTTYTLDGGAPQNGTTVTVAGEGVHTLEFWSVDNAGNDETRHSVTIRIDKTAPTISHAQEPPANEHGWNNTPVAVTFSCADDRSGVASCSNPTTLTDDGANQTVVGSATDQAGNPATDVATVNIDQVKPTITSSRDRDPNTNGWYNADVTVSYSCTDALSGIASCTGPRTFGEGADQTAHGQAVDLAANTAEVSDTGINVDKTAPLLTGVPTSAPNTNGWYRGDVTIHWTCSDAGSGIDGACPADSTITGEGADLHATTSVTDKAGNTTTTSVSGIKIDRTAPSTSATAPSVWVNDDVTVSLSAQDSLSGVEHTYFSLDGGVPQAGTSVPIDTEGVHTLEYWSADTAGNTEAHSTVTVRIDKSSPTITHTQAPLPNGAGWNNSPVTVSFDCADSVSGIASCTAPQTVAGEGAGQVVNGVAIDHAGNAATDPVTLNVDTTPPTITAAPDRAPNANGWYNAGVTVTYTCGDALSGVVSCSDPAPIGQGAGQHATGTAVDSAGNTATATLADLNVDATPPTITGAPTSAPNANGWYSGDVTIHWTCSDALSGLSSSCPADSVITGEGSALSASASVSDNAGNVASATVDHIKIDRTTPGTTSDAPSAWQKSDTTVTFTAGDNLSGVAGTYAKVDGGATQAGPSVTISAEGTHSVVFWSVDRAGNVELPHTATVRIDKTAPTIAGAPTSTPNGAGWYRSPVTVHFTCADQSMLSGLAGCTADQTLATSGANQSATGLASDNAGNANSTNVGGINIDLVPPTVAITGVADGGVYQLGAVPTPSCVANDGLSGPAGCSGVVSGGNANGVGTYTYTATGRDAAGNATTRTATYRVGYVFSDFLQPINNPGHQVGVQTSVFKGGSTVPVKFQLRRADGTAIAAGSSPQWLTPVKGAPMSASVDESLYTAPATSGDTFRGDANQYIYNWSTKGLPAGYYYRIGVRLDDGSVYTVNIGLS